MSGETLTVLNLRRLPGRVCPAEAALLLGFQKHDISALIRSGLLKPLGDPAPNAPKYFATVAITILSQDSEWLSKATKALAKHWTGKNRRKKSQKPINPAPLSVAA